MPAAIDTLSLVGTKGLGYRVEKKLGLASIVLLAQNHNPSILSPEFLASKKIIAGAASNFAHTPVLSVVEYKDKQLALNVIPDRFGINFAGDITDASVSEMARIVIAYFSCLPETPITALGINFHGELTFQSMEELYEFQNRWLKPIGLSDHLHRLKINWGSTAKFVLPEVDSVVTLKIEPGPKRLLLTFLVNGHFDVKGTGASIELLKQRPVDLLKFSSTLMSEL